MHASRAMRVAGVAARPSRVPSAALWHTMCVTMRTARMNLRLAEEADDRIRRAAAASGVSTSAFVERAASVAADAVLADRREFVLAAARREAGVRIGERDRVCACAQEHLSDLHVGAEAGQLVLDAPHVAAVHAHFKAA